MLQQRNKLVVDYYAIGPVDQFDKRPVEIEQEAMAGGDQRRRGRECGGG
jgi:hypothetical protein